MKKLLSLIATMSTIILLLFPSVALADDSFLIGDWTTSSGDASFTFYADGTCASDFGLWPERGTWKTQDTGSAAFPIEIDGSSVLRLMQLAYGGVDESYHFEVLKCNNDNFFLVQVYGEYNAWTSRCKLPLTRVGAKADFTLPPEEGRQEVEDASGNDEDLENAVERKQVKFDDKNTVNLNWGWNLFNKDSSEYDHNIAMAGLVLSQAAEMSQSEAESRLGDLGFENQESIYYSEETAAFKPATTFGSKVIWLNGEKKVIVAVVVRGTGDDGDIRTDIWSQLEGFSTSASNVESRFMSYYRKLGKRYGFTVNASNTILFLTGHSLGAAVAGQLGERLEGSCSYRQAIFDYNFAPPNYNTPANRDELTNIHGIVNIRDNIPNVPVGFKKNGHIWYYDREDSKYQSYLDEVYDANGWKPDDVDWGEHILSTYLALMLCGLPNNMGDGAVNPYSLTSVHCPVDIAVYSPEGVLMGKTDGENVTLEKTSAVLVMTEGDSKYVFAPPGEPYTVKIMGTDSGEMTVMQQSVDPYTGDAVSEKSFKSVAVEEGRQFMLEVSGDAQVDDVLLEAIDGGEQQGLENIGQSGSGEGGSGFQWWYILVAIGAVALVFVILLVIGTVKNNRKAKRRSRKTSGKRKRK